MKKRLGQIVRFGLFILALTVVAMLPPLRAYSAPYAALVMDARTGEVLYAKNADARLHPASLTKMMTLYIAFEAVTRGEISLDTMVTISSKAANEPPSKLGLKPGQRIALRYLVRAAAVKSANDAATAIGEAIEGSEAAFARRMNRTAKALGMTRTTFKNAHGLTEDGHLSTARDMSMLGRHVFYDYPQYYNLFSRRTADVGGRQVSHTNRRFLDAYPGADGIKTGYTGAAGFNLVASAERGGERIITTVFGGRSTADRNAKVAELMDMGFRRAPSSTRVKKPPLPAYSNADPETVAVVASASSTDGQARVPAGKIIRLVGAVSKSPKPLPRPGAPGSAPETLVAGLQDDILSALQEAQAEVAVAQAATAPVIVDVPADAADADAAVTTASVAAAPDAPIPSAPTEQTAALASAPLPEPRPANLVLASVAVDPVIAAQPAVVDASPVVVTRMSTSGGRHWGINIGRYPSRYQAESVLLKTALNELGTLDEALRKVVQRSGGYDANFVGLSEEQAGLACRRLQARHLECQTMGPG